MENRIRKMRKDRNKERRNLTQNQQPGEKRRKMESGFEESRREWGKPKGGNSVGKRSPTELYSNEPRNKRARYEDDGMARYAEFGGNNEVELFDWKGKMEQYKKEMKQRK